MSTAMIGLAAQSVARILGDIEGIEISIGLVGVTVLLRGDPVVTITPVGGLYLVKTLKSLDARPFKSDHVAYVTATRDPDWVAFQSPRINDVRVALHQSEPKLRWRSATVDRLVAELEGTLELLDIDEADPTFWSMVADWAEMSGAMSGSRNLVKWARIYADNLAKGRSISERFQAWGHRTAAAARDGGFRPIRGQTTAHRQAGSVVDDSEQAPIPSLAAPDLAVDTAALDELCAVIGSLSERAARRLSLPGSPENEDRLVPVRARLIRAVPSDTRLRVRQRVRVAAAASPAAGHVSPDLWLAPVVDAAYAAAAGNRVGREDRELLAKRWYEAISVTDGRPD